MQTNCIFHVLVVVEDSHQHTDQGRCQEVFFAIVTNFQVFGIVCQIQIQKCFFKEFHIFLSVILNDAVQNLMRNLNMLQSARKNKSLKVFKESLFDSSFSKHRKQLTKQVINCSNFDAKLRRDSQSFRLHHLPFLKFFDAGIYVLSQQILHAFPELMLSLLSLVWKAGKSDNLSCKDIKSCTKNLQPVLVVTLANKVKILLPVKKLALANS